MKLGREKGVWKCDIELKWVKKRHASPIVTGNSLDSR